SGSSKISQLVLSKQSCSSWEASLGHVLTVSEMCIAVAVWLMFLFLESGCPCPNYARFSTSTLLTSAPWKQSFHMLLTLSEVAGSSDPTITADHMRAMGLDPQGDRSFLEDLLEVYGIDITLVIDNLCCS
ncbi:hypothetical protein XENOCAPTIV_023656, partial [Xenoophorus captivus]